MANSSHPYLASNLGSEMPNMTQQHFTATGSATANAHPSGPMANNIATMQSATHGYHQQMQHQQQQQQQMPQQLQGPLPMNDLNLGTSNSGYGPSAAANAATAASAAAATAAQYNSGVAVQPHPMYQIPPTMPLSIQVI